MKTFFTFIICSFFISFYSNAQELDCKKFKNGEFKILKDSVSEGSIIIRKGDVQIEHLIGKEDTTELIVNWVDDCTYTLKPKDMSLPEFKGLPENALLKVEIIEVKENSYIQRTTANFAPIEVISEMHKTK